MSFLSGLRTRIRLLFVRAAPAAPQIVVYTVPEPPPAAKASRSASSTLNRTIELLAENPGISAAEVASILSVSLSYARTLLRRAKSSTPVMPEVPVPAPVRGIAAVTPAVPDVQDTIRTLSNRLTETEKSLATLRSLPLHSRASMNLNRRAEVLRLIEAGQDPASVAERLAIPAGEVDFILKVDRILASAVQNR